MALWKQRLYVIFLTRFSANCCYYYLTENAFAFVYREASAPMFVTAPLMSIPPMEAVGQPLKRKGSPPGKICGFNV